MTDKPLKIGLLLDDYIIPAWTLVMIEEIMASDYAEINLVVVNDNDKIQENKTVKEKLSHNSGRLPYLIVRRSLEAIYSKLIERNTYLTNAEEPKDSHELLQSITSIKVKTIRKTWSDYFQPSDIKKIEQHTPDILLRLGFGILRGDILKSARYGIWSFHHGDNRVNRGGPAGYWESMQGWPDTGSVLQILSEDLDNGKILYRSFSCTNAMSVQDNKSNYYWKTLSFVSRKLRELHSDGAEKFFAKVDDDNRHPEFYSERLYTQPNNTELAKLTFNKVLEKISHLYRNKFVLDQWILMFDLKEEFSSSLWRYKKIIPPVDRFWADPYIIHRDGKYYIYIEEYPYATDKGHISLITMDEEGNYDEPQVVLDKPYHLSYPYVFEHEGVTYMIPESMDNRTIELYECTEFPDKWEFKMNLMQDIIAVDATLLRHNGKWWMFANVLEREDMSSFDELCVFYSDELLSNEWTPHRMNPVISDCSRARPAGNFFEQQGKIYRPSQNCSTRYGYGYNISEVTTLNENDYSEELVSSVKPNWDKKIIGTHTFNRVGNLHIIDAIYRRRK